MFISRIEAWNFGVIAHRRLDLVNGHIIVRANNEAGKTTMLSQVPLYAFFGSATLDDTLDDVVTMDVPVGELRVEVDYGKYTVKRSKGSASVTGDGVKISGQKEVTKFFHNLFEITKGSEEYILISKQGDAAGILNGKPTKVTEFIEQIAGFDQIDDLLASVKSKFPYGSATILKDRIDSSKEELLELKKWESPNLEEVKKSIEKTENIITSGKVQLFKYKEKEAKLTKELLRVTKIQGDIKTKKSELKFKEESLVNNRLAIKNLENKEYEGESGEQIAWAEDFVESFDRFIGERKSYEWASVLASPAVTWDGDFDSLLEELSTVKNTLSETQSYVNKSEGKISTLKESLLKDAICTKCGQDTKDFVVINSRIIQEIEEEEKRVEAEELKLKELKSERDVLSGVVEEHRSIEAMFKSLKFGKSSIEIDKSEVPHNYAWFKDTPGEPKEIDLIYAKGIIKDQNKISVEMSLDKERVEELKNLLPKLEQDVSEKAEELKVMSGAPPSDPIESELRKLGLKIAKATETVEGTTLDLSDLRTDLLSKETLIQTHRDHMERVKKEIVKLKSELSTDSRNSKITRSVKAAKPLVLNMVWDKILYSVSQTFSQMRGTESVVTRTEKGFRINGLSVSRLSGSAKSILGVALRSALRDVFAPSCGFLVWDEPAADCDRSRAATLIGSIQGIEGQNIVITHEEDSEASADQIIEW